MTMTKSCEFTLMKECPHCGAAGVLLVPYAMWATFAAVLHFSIWRMNA